MDVRDRGVAFSCAFPLGGDGPSRPLTRIYQALEREWGGRFVGGPRFVGIHPGVVPAIGDVRRLGDGLGPSWDCISDHYLSRRLGDLKTLSPVFLGSGGASLMQIRNGDISRSGTLWFSSHFEYADRVLREEYKHFGVDAKPIHDLVKWRAGKEQEESDFVVVPSEKCLSTYPKEVREKAHVAEFGVDSERFKPAERAPSSKLRVLFQATNPPRKGLRSVLRAIGHLPGDKFEFTFAGGYQQDLPLPPSAPKVKMTGWVSDDEMLRLYQSHDVFLLPSLEEGQALASLEAAACGLPLVVTPQVGLPANIVARHVDPGNGMQIADALASLHRDEGDRLAWGKKARAFAEERTWERFQRRIVKILKDEGA